MSLNRRSLFSCALLFLAIFMVHGRGLHGYFMADDFGFLGFAQSLADRDPWYGLSWFWLSREGAGPEVAKLYRPLSDLSFALQFRFCGADAFSFHLANLLLHGGSSCLLMGILWRLLRSSLAAVAAGLLFALSPAHPESLLWISSRMNLMAGFFILLSLYAFMHRGPRGRGIPGAVALVAAVCAMFSKETGLIVAPLLSLYAFCFPAVATSSLRARLLGSGRVTWPAWLLLVAYFILRYLSLGTVLGGYQGIDLLGSDYWLSRMHLPLLYISPVHLGELALWCKYFLLLLNLGLLFGAILYLRRRGSAGAIAGLLVGWILLSLMPTYAAPFGSSTWTLLQNSRLLYEPSMALALLLALGLAGVPSPGLAVGAVACSALIYGSIAWQNSQPWIEMGQASAAVHEQAQRWQGEDFDERWLVDVPGVESGAYLFFDPDPALRAPAFPAGLDQRVRLRRRSQWRQLMRRVDRALDEGRAQGLELYRFELSDLSIQAEGIPLWFPVQLGQGLELRYLRAARRKLHPGEDIPIQALLSESPVAPPTLVVGLFDKSGGEVAVSSHEVLDTLTSWTLSLPHDLAAGTYEFRLWQLQEGAEDVDVLELGSIQVLPR